MALVPKDEMTTLRTASDAASTASSAEDDIQPQAIAYAINEASNTGLYRVTFQSKISETNQSTLESKGYTIKYVGDAYDAERHAIISWSE